jgi:hypothetical protein
MLDNPRCLQGPVNAIFDPRPPCVRAIGAERFDGCDDRHRSMRADTFEQQRGLEAEGRQPRRGRCWDQDFPRPVQQGLENRQLPAGSTFVTPRQRPIRTTFPTLASSPQNWKISIPKPCGGRSATSTCFSPPLNAPITLAQKDLLPGLNPAVLPLCRRCGMPRNSSHAGS